MKLSLGQSTSTVSAATVLSRGLGFVRDMVIATTLGAGGGVDAFLVALKVPGFLRRFFAEGAMTQAFIPVFIAERKAGGRASAGALVARVSGTLLGVLVVIVVAGLALGPMVFSFFAPGFADDPVKQQLGGELLNWTLPYLLPISMAALATAALNSSGNFLVPALAPLWFSLCIIAAALIAPHSIHLLAVAVFTSGVLQLLSQLPLLHRAGYLHTPIWGWSDPAVAAVRSMMLPILLGTSAQQLSLLLDSVFASFMGDGAVSWLYYAERLVQFPLAAIGAALGTVALPALSARFVQGKATDFMSVLDWSTGIVAFLGIPISVGFYFMAVPLVTTLFNYRAFHASDVAMTSDALMAYAVSVPPMLLLYVIVAALFARRESGLAAKYGTIALAVDLAGSLLAVVLHRETTLPISPATLALVSSLAAWINCTLILNHLYKRGGWRWSAGTRALCWRSVAAGVAMAIALRGAVALAGAFPEGLGERLLTSAVLILVSGAVYIGGAALLGVRLPHLRPAQI
jgi:putative peptidoglycan lipid II flippase